MRQLFEFTAKAAEDAKETLISFAILCVERFAS
jgi:hypothetical protein